MSGNEYTPSMENLRSCYVFADENYDGSLSTPVPIANAEFDRAIAAHDAELWARAAEIARQVRTADLIGAWTNAPKGETIQACKERIAVAIELERGGSGE